MFNVLKHYDILSFAPHPQPMVPTIEDIYTANVETNRGIKEQVRFYDTKGLVSFHFQIFQIENYKPDLQGESERSTTGL